MSDEESESRSGGESDGESNSEESSESSSEGDSSSSSDSSSARKRKKGSAKTDKKAANGKEGPKEPKQRKQRVSNTPTSSGEMWSVGLLNVHTDKGSVYWNQEQVLSGISAMILAEYGNNGAFLEVTPEALAVFDAQTTVLLKKLGYGFAFANWEAKRTGVYYDTTTGAPTRTAPPDSAPNVLPRNVAIASRFDSLYTSLLPSRVGGVGRVSCVSNSGVSVPSVCIPKATARPPRAKPKKAPSKQ
jgi:hypothetical protein